MQYEEITNEIIGAAYKVYNTLGFGYLESVYQNAMLIEFRKRKINALSEAKITVYYENEKVGNFEADLYVEDKIIIELKSASRLVKRHEVQLVNYLTSTKKEVGLLINFGEDKVHVKRKVRQLTPKS